MLQNVSAFETLREKTKAVIAFLNELQFIIESFVAQNIFDRVKDLEGDTLYSKMLDVSNETHKLAADYKILVNQKIDFQEDQNLKDFILFSKDAFLRQVDMLDLTAKNCLENVEKGDNDTSSFLDRVDWFAGYIKDFFDKLNLAKDEVENTGDFGVIDGNLTIVNYESSIIKTYLNEINTFLDSTLNSNCSGEDFTERMNAQLELMNHSIEEVEKALKVLKTYVSDLSEFDSVIPNMKKVKVAAEKKILEAQTYMKECEKMQLEKNEVVVLESLEKINNKIKKVGEIILKIERNKKEAEDIALKENINVYNQISEIEAALERSREAKNSIEKIYDDAKKYASNKNFTQDQILGYVNGKSNVEKIVDIATLALMASSAHFAKVRRKVNNISSFSEFLGWFSGVPIKKYRTLGSEAKNKRSIYSSLVLFSTAIGTTSMASAFADIENSILIGLLVFILWGGFMVMLNRAISHFFDSLYANITSYRENEKKEKNEFALLVAPGVLIVALVLFFISCTTYIQSNVIVMSFFRKEVVRELVLSKKDAISKVKEQMESKNEGITKKIDEAQKKIGFYNDAYDKTMAHYQADLDSARNKWNEDRKLVLEEWEKGNISVGRKPGRGNVARAKEELMKADSNAYEKAKQNYDNNKSKVHEFEDKRIAQKNIDSVIVDLRRSIRENKKETDEKIAEMKSLQSDGLIDRTNALKAVSKGNLLAWFLTKLVYIIEAIALILKIVLYKDEYVDIIVEDRKALADRIAFSDQKRKTENNRKLNSKTAERIAVVEEEIDATGKLEALLEELIKRKNKVSLLKIPEENTVAT